jgi:hypothetical protein
LNSVPIEDTQRPERPFQDIGHVPNTPFATTPGPRSGPGEAGLSREAGLCLPHKNKNQANSSVVAAG